MIARAFGFVSLLVALALLGMLALGRHGSPKATSTPATQLCQHVATFRGTLTGIQGRTVSNEQAIASLGQAQESIALDAQREQSPVIATWVARLAGDISDARNSLISGDVAGRDAAINRALSDLASLPTC